MADPEEFNRELPEQLSALRAFAIRLTENRADADDLFQETVARALASAHQYSPGTRLRSWLFTICRNIWFNEHRRRSRERPGFEADSHPGCSAANQEWRLHGMDTADALDRLNETQVDLLVFVAMDGGTYEAAAKRFGCEVGTVKSRLNRARMALATEMRLESGRELSGNVPGPHAWSAWQVVPL
jgi:RNA polymerase sigma-70 factor, ECF subfamily